MNIAAPAPVLVLPQTQSLSRTRALLRSASAEGVGETPPCGETPTWHGRLQCG